MFPSRFWDQRKRQRKIETRAIYTSEHPLSVVSQEMPQAQERQAEKKSLIIDKVPFSKAVTSKKIKGCQKLMLLRDFLPKPCIKRVCTLYRIVHFEFDNCTQIPFKAYPPKPEVCLYFNLRDRFNSWI